MLYIDDEAVSQHCPFLVKWWMIKEKQTYTNLKIMECAKYTTELFSHYVKAWNVMNCVQNRKSLNSLIFLLDDRRLFLFCLLQRMFLSIRRSRQPHIDKNANWITRCLKMSWHERVCKCEWDLREKATGRPKMPYLVYSK